MKNYLNYKEDKKIKDKKIDENMKIFISSDYYESFALEDYIEGCS